LNFDKDSDPGVLLVKDCFSFMIKNSYETKVMGASFRNIDQILSLMGIHLLTISPSLIHELMKTQKYPEPFKASNYFIDPAKFSVKTQQDFEKCLGEDEMARDLLEKGIAKFTEDLIKLKEIIEVKLKKIK
jgi:transaldolase